MTTTATCDRCGKTYRGEPDWNVIYRHGVTVGHRCPDDQTPEDNAEAEIRAAGASFYQQEVRVAHPGDPEHGEVVALHVLAIADEVLSDFMRSIAQSGEAAAFDPHALAEETLSRLAGTIGTGAIRDREHLVAELEGHFKDSVEGA